MSKHPRIGALVAALSLSLAAPLGACGGERKDDAAHNTPAPGEDGNRTHTDAAASREPEHRTAGPGEAGTRNPLGAAGGSPRSVDGSAKPEPVPQVPGAEQAAGGAGANLQGGTAQGAAQGGAAQGGAAQGGAAQGGAAQDSGAQGGGDGQTR